VSYKHLSSEDRVVIATLLEESRTDAYIARRLGVDRSSIGREIVRGSSKPKPKVRKHLARPKILDVDGRQLRGSGFTKTKYEVLERYNEAVVKQAKASRFYYAGVANKRTKARHKAANQKRIRLVHGSGSFLEKYVLEKLQSEQWSPDQIAGRLLEFECISISPQTIYDYIYSSSDKKQLVKHLRHGGNKYRRKHGTVARVKNQQDSLPSIHTRAAVIEARTRLDDYEGDTVVGLDKKDRLLTYVDRTSGECLIGLVLGFSAVKITKKTLRMAQANQATLGTITYDRGTEFADYESIQQQTKSKIYFADAYSSYQRGSNENLNGLIRQYYPKRSDFKHLTQKQVTKVQTKLNGRPRKRYDYRTPVEQRAYLLNLQIVAVRD
jgi:transposase, IS30 family